MTIRRRSTRILAERLESRFVLVGDPIASIYPPSEVAQQLSRFGSSVAASADYHVVGAPYADTNGLYDTGLVKVYDAGSHDLVATLLDPTPESRDDFGGSVATAGRFVVVGASNEVTGGYDSGSVYLYDFDSDPTVPALRIPNPAPDRRESFGESVAMSGDYLIVGVPNDHSVGAGLVYVFDLGAAEPTIPILELHGPAAPYGENFGKAVDVDGNYVVVADDRGGVGRHGVVRVYDLTDADPEDPILTLNNPRLDSFDFFGRSIAIDGKWIAVGAHYEDADADNAGAAYVYDITSSQPSLPAFTLVNPTPAEDDHFGYAVAVTGDQVVVGAYWDSTVAELNGAAYLYDLASSDPTQAVELQNPSDSSSVLFGSSIAAYDSQVIVGAPLDHVPVANSGTVHLFDLNSSTPTIALTTYQADETQSTVAFGASVAMSDEYLVVGALDEYGDDFSGGAVYVYDRAANDLSVPAHVLTKSEPGYEFGHAIAVDGNLVVASQPNARSVYVYDLSSADPNLPIMELENPSNGGWFGYSVAIEGRHVVVGAYSDANTGSAFVYDLDRGPFPIARLYDDRVTTRQRFGFSVDISNGKVVVGAPAYDGKGATFVYDLASVDMTSPVAVLENPSFLFDWFGRSVSIDGDRLAVGANYAAYLYDLSEPGTVSPSLRLGDPFPSPFGSHVSLNYPFLAVSAPDSTRGAAHLFDLSSAFPEDPVWSLDGFWPNRPEVGGYTFPVAVADNAFAVGSPFDPTINYQQGSAHLFSLADSNRLFYNDSAFDGYDASASSADDSALSAVRSIRAGEGAGWNNTSSFVHGVNGLMIDIAHLPTSIAVTLADFTFRTGRNDDTTTWSTMPNDPSIAIRPGDGVSGSDRITITWPNGTITNTWLEVTVKANQNTGLAEDDIFYFGNQIGDTNGDGLTNAIDFQNIRANPSNFLNPADVDNVFDINKDGRVNAIDLLIVRDHATILGESLPMITPSGPSLQKIDQEQIELATVVRQTKRVSPEPLEGKPSPAMSDLFSSRETLIDLAILSEFSMGPISSNATHVRVEFVAADPIAADPGIGDFSGMPNGRISAF